MKRTGTALLLGVIAWLGAAPSASSGDAGRTATSAPVARNFRVERLADGVYAVARNDPPGMMCDGNSGFIVNRDGVVVIDAPESSADVLAAIRKITKKPIRTVINTHWHVEHYLEAAVADQTRLAAREGNSLEETRPRVDLASYREALAGASKVRRMLFDMYVQGPAVTSAYHDVAPDSTRP